MILLGQSDIEYHADPAIGSTDAKLALDSIQKLRDQMDGLIPRRDSRAFQFGRVVHARFTDRAHYDAMISTGPLNPKTGKPFGPDTNAFADWQAQNPGKVVLGARDLADLDLMDQRMPDRIRAIFADPLGVPESSYYQTIAGVKVKARPDWISGGVIYDLKSIGNLDDAERHITKYRYWFSHAWYRMVVKAECGKSLPFRFVFAEKNSPYRWQIVDIDAEWIGYADTVCERVMTDIALAQDRGDWSDRGELEVVASRPAWEGDNDESEESDE